MRSVVVRGIQAICLGVLLCQLAWSATRTAPQVQDVILLDQLVNLYEPVPFDHKSHADMADMWDGCTTCHHHQPAPADGATTRPAQTTQRDTVTVPACKSCHPIEAELGTIQLPSLKGAYHRQCLNCHREWTGANACGACHAPRGEGKEHPAPTPDDITGRMHKPIPSPETINIVARYTPVAGPNVLFRHKAHAEEFGIRCSTCHRHDSCSNCHSESAAATAMPTKGSRLMKAGATWREAHEPCSSCHANDDCTRCHYQPGANPPRAFEHAMSGQFLSEPHLKLQCNECHTSFKSGAVPSCGDARCHEKAIAFPADRPGPVALPAVKQATAAVEQVAPDTVAGPATRPVVIRVRRGGL